MKKKLLIGVCAVALTFVLTGCTSQTTLKNGEKIVAKIKGQTYTAEDLYNILKTKYGADTLVSMIDEYIANKEVKTDADANNYADSTIKSYKTQYEKNGQKWADVLKNAGYGSEEAFRSEVILGYKQKKITESYVKDNLTDKEIQDYYDNNIYGDIKVKSILISPNTTDKMSDSEKTKAENQAKSKAEKVINKLKSGSKFETLAKKYSDDDSTKSSGGNMTATYGDVPDEFWTAASNLKDDKYTTSPVKTDYGYYVIYRVSQGTKPTLKKVENNVKEKLVSKKMDEDSTLTTKALVDIRKKYNLVFKDSTIKSSYNKKIKDALNSSSSNSSTSSSATTNTTSTNTTSE